MFTPEQLQIIDAALVRMPYGQVAALIAEINKQLAEQQKPKDPVPPASVPQAPQGN